MWADRPPERTRRRLVERLRGVLPAPDPSARGARTPLRARSLPGPQAVAEELRSRPGFAWLDGERRARLAAEPLAVLEQRGGRARATGPGGTTSFAARGLDLLEAALAAWGGGGGMLVGFLGAELASELEALPPPPPDDLGLPDLRLALFDAALAWDGRGWTLEATHAWRRPAESPALAAERLLERAARQPAAVSPELTARHAGPFAQFAASRPGRGGFEAAVAAAVERIRDGELFQVNLCRRLEAPLPPALAWPLYRRLRAASPAAHGAFLDLGPHRGRPRALLSVSPELFLSVSGRAVETRPIKGTRPRGATPREDRALARELSESEKDRAELAMIVDVARNDLGRVCEPGSVEVAAHAELVTLPTVHHTVSTVRGRLLPEAGPADLLRAAFPAASISGAPKIQALAVAAASEERRRGPAMGAFGWIGMNGDLELAVAIRTAVAARGRVAYHAGCGITAESDPEEEWAESAAKARAFLEALGAREAG